MNKNICNKKKKIGKKWKKKKKTRKKNKKKDENKNTKSGLTENQKIDKKVYSI